jgi:hypothetical protein
MHEEQERGQIKVAGSTVYVLNDERKPSNLWSANVQPGRDDEGRRISQEACEAVAQQIAASLAKPQPVGGALTDEQVDAALEAWFASVPAGIDHKTDRTRMRAALAATLSAPVAQPGGIDWEAEYHGAEAVLTEIRTAMNGSGRWKLGDELVSSIRALIAVAQPGEAAQQAINALEAAKNGLEWYRDARPMLTDGSDDEMDAQIDAAILALAAPAQAAAVPEAVATDEQIKQALMKHNDWAEGITFAGAIRAFRALAAPAQAAAVEHPDTERFRKALEQVKYRDASLADAQVTALRALLAFDDEYPRSQAAAVPSLLELAAQAVEANRNQTPQEWAAKMMDGLDMHPYPDGLAVQAVAVPEAVARTITDDELDDLSHSAYEEAMGFGLSRDVFMRYFRTIRDRLAGGQGDVSGEGEGS